MDESQLKSLFLTLAGPALLLAGTALADQTESIVEHMVVTGARLPESPEQVPADIQVIDAEMIADSGAQTLAQVLNGLAGIQIQDNIGNMRRGVSISLRGFGENGVNNVLVLVNGHKLNNPSLAGPDLSVVPLRDIERIEILHGSASSLYGDQTSGGVINIITRQVNEQALLLSAARGSDDLERYYASIDQRLGEQFAVRAAVDVEHADNYRDNNNSDRERGLLHLNFHNGWFSGFAEWQQDDDRLRLPGALSESQIRDDRRQAGTPGQYSNRETTLQRLAGRFVMNDRQQLHLDLAQREEEGSGEIFGSMFTTLTEVRTLQPKWTGQWPLTHGELLLTAGADIERTEYQSDYGFGATSFSQDTDDLYAQISAPLSKDFRTVIAGRRSEFSLSDQQSGQAIDDQLSVFQLGFNYQLDAHWRSYLRFDQGFRWPNADENGFIPASLTSLTPQESETVDFGVEYQQQHLRLTLGLFSMDVENEIVFDPLADGPWGPGTGANINLPASERQGANVSVRWQATDALDLHWHYRHTDAELSSAPFAGNEVPLAAERVSNAVIRYAFSEQWSLYADAVYTGPRYRAGDNSNVSELLGGYTVFNASLRWQLRNWQWQLRVNNLSDKRYNGYSGGLSPFAFAYPAALAQYALSVEYRQ